MDIITNTTMFDIQFDDIKNIDYIEIENPLLVNSCDSYSLYNAKYDKKHVSLKIFKSPSKNSIRQFIKELDWLRALQSSEHVIKLYGYMLDISVPLCGLVVDNNCFTLRNFLDMEKDIDYIEKTRIIIDAAKGLKALHNSYLIPILHKNLSSDSFYLTKNGVLKIGSGAPYNISNRVNFMAYFDYDMLKDIFSNYTIKSEIYRFGIVMWEIITCKIPFENMDYQEIYNMLIKENKGEYIPLDCPIELQGIIIACRTIDPVFRPSISTITEFLENFYSNIIKNRNLK
nr:tyrosine protein kinase [Oriental turtle dovepox virus]